MSPRSAAPSKSFYEARRLNLPAREFSPEGTAQLCQLLDELHRDNRAWTLVGDGQHLRRDLKDQVAVRTTGLSGVQDVDPTSGTVRVGSGTTWRELQKGVDHRGLSLQRYDLQPPSATVGGLLARRRPGPPLLRGGSLLDGCVGLGVHKPAAHGYRYLTAPRKATGPDLRHLFAGNDGGDGAILEATLVAWRPVGQRLLRFEGCDLDELTQIMDGLFRAGIMASWVHYKLSNQTLQMALTGPGQLLRSRINWIAENLRPPDEMGDRETSEKRRRWLEARHPARREHRQAPNTRVFAVLPAALKLGAAELFGPHVKEAEIIHWTPRRAMAFARYDNPVTADELQAPPAGSCWADWPLMPLH